MHLIERNGAAEPQPAGKRFVWLLRKPSGLTFRPKRNQTARQVKRCAERLIGASWRELWTAGYRVERVPVQCRRRL